MATSFILSATPPTASLITEGSLTAARAVSAVAATACPAVPLCASPCCCLAAGLGLTMPAKWRPLMTMLCAHRYASAATAVTERNCRQTAVTE